MTTTTTTGSSTSATTSTSSIAFQLGIGSGIDTTTLISQLTAAQRASKDQMLSQRLGANKAQISALGDVSSAITSFSSALQSLISGGTLFSQPTVSDDSVFSATALAGARIGDLSAGLEVDQLATAQTVQSAAFASAGSAVGQGTLTITNGNGSMTVTIDSTNNSLSGLAKAINDQHGAISASIVTDSSGARLVLKSGTGSAQAFAVSTGAGSDASLAQFAYGPSVTGGMTLAQQAQDAIVKLDGVQVTRSSNSFSDLIPGVQINLKHADVGNVVSIGVSHPTDAIEQGLSDFVTAYNQVMQIINQDTAIGSDGTAGVLQGDTAIRQLAAQLGHITTTALTGSGSGPHTLAEIGVQTNQDGTLTVDTSQLESMLAEDPNSVEALFNPTQTSSDPAVTILSAMGKVKPGTYTLTNLVPGSGSTAASGFVDGQAMTGVGSNLIAPANAAALGLVIGVGASVSSATIIVELGLGGALKAISDALASSSGAYQTDLARLQSQAKQITQDQADVDTQSTQYQSQLQTAFSTMESRVTSYKATQSYLTQQVALWTKSDS